MEVVGRVLGHPRIGRADRLVRHPGAVQRIQRLGGKADRVVVERHAGVAPVPRQVDVPDLVMQRQAVGRKVGLQETPVPLRLDPGHLVLDRLGEPAVDPGRDLHHRDRIG